LTPQNLTKQLESFFLLKIQKRKTKIWIIHQTLKTTKLDFLGAGFLLLQIKENIEILINLSNS
jgi:hypothetical protein